MAEDSSFSYVHVSEGDGSEVDGPDILGDLFETNVLSGEKVGDVDPRGVPSDPTVGRDLPELEVGGVLRVYELAWERPSRGLIGGSGRFLP